MEIKTVRVHTFTVSDADDPDIYAAQFLVDWEKSEKGQWVMEHAVDVPEWHRFLDPVTYGYHYVIVAKLKDKDYTFWTLKWG